MRYRIIKPIALTANLRTQRLSQTAIVFFCFSFPSLRSTELTVLLYLCLLVCLRGMCYMISLFPTNYQGRRIDTSFQKAFQKRSPNKLTLHCKNVHWFHCINTWTHNINFKLPKSPKTCFRFRRCVSNKNNFNIIRNVTPWRRRRSITLLWLYGSSKRNPPMTPQIQISLYKMQEKSM